MSRFTPFALLLAGALLVGYGAGCQKDKDTDDHHGKQVNAKDMANKPLWDRLGGERAVRKVVDDFVALGTADDKVNFTRQGHPNQWDPNAPGAMERLKHGLVTFISQNTGGPLRYKGRTMEAVHQGMRISEAEFNALAADLGKALDKNKVPAKEKNELISVVASTKGSIVGK
jgi:hemoglobin